MKRINFKILLNHPTHLVWDTLTKIINYILKSVTSNIIMSLQSNDIINENKLVGTFYKFHLFSNIKFSSVVVFFKYNFFFLRLTLKLSILLRLLAPNFNSKMNKLYVVIKFYK